MVSHYSLGSIIYGFKLYGKLSSREFKQFMITVVKLGFLIGFSDKRPTTKMDSYYLFFMLFSMATAALAIFIKIFIQRFFLYKFGYNPDYEYSINSLLIGVVLIFATSGFVWFLPSGTSTATLLQSERLGKWRMGLKHVEHARALVFGIVGLVLFTIILKFFVTPNSVFLSHMMKVNMAIAFYSLLPTPESDGIYIFFGGYRWLWVFTLAFVIFSAVLLKLLQSPIAVMFGAAGIAAVAAIITSWKWGTAA